MRPKGTAAVFLPLIISLLSPVAIATIRFALLFVSVGSFDLDIR